MSLPGPQYLGLTYLVSEVLLTITHRSRGTGVRQDRSTLRVLWLVILISVTVGIFVASNVHAASLPHRELCRLFALLFFTAGIALRWWSIVTLGRFFTVDVQIAPDQELVERGPFRWVRHPSYTGVLLAFVGFALSLANFMSLLVILIPISAAFVRRMNVEEQALTRALGDRYLNYMGRTKRLVPGVY